jgi:hypothetical protein
MGKRILIIDIDSKIKNLALYKIAKYYEEKNYEVIWDYQLAKGTVDYTYVSCVFTKNKFKCAEWEGIGNVEIGGSGYSLTKTLPEDIERVLPRINLGFTTRGCIRKCEFCIVPEKEGKIHPVGDLLDLWDGEVRDIVVLDNNILALPDHFRLVCKQTRENKIRVDFNQGLDHRLLDSDTVKELTSIRHVEYRFAFDHPSYIGTVSKAIDMLQSGGIRRCSWYVLVGFNTTLKEDIDRLNFLRERNQNAYVQRYETCYHQKDYISMARWANQHHLFQALTWEQFKEKERRLKLA